MTRFAFASCIVLGTLACAPTAGWTRGDRVCEEDDPPRVCFDARPDAPVSLQVADVRLAPGECAFALEGERGGSLRVVLEDGESGKTKGRRIPVRRGKTTIVTADGHRMDVRRTKCASTR